MAQNLNIQRIHHINFLVKDLTSAIERYQQWFGVEISEPQRLTERGVVTAKFRLGEVWIVLVQPENDNGVPAQHLREHGEGFFLMSCQVDDVVEAAQQIISNGGSVENSIPRQGLEDWQVIDLPADELFGATIQLVQTEEKPC